MATAGLQWSDAEEAILFDACKRLSVTGCVPVHRLDELLDEIAPLLPNRNRRGIVVKGRKSGCIDLSPYKDPAVPTGEDRFRAAMTAAPERRLERTVTTPSNNTCLSQVSAPATYMPSASNIT